MARVVALKPHLMRILFTFLLITLTATAAHTHTAIKCGNSGNSSSNTAATVSTNPANLFVSTSPRFATLGQLPLSGVSDNGHLDQLYLPLSPPLPLTCILLSHSLSASIPNGTNITMTSSCIETAELIRLMRRGEGN